MKIVISADANNVFDPVCLMDFPKLDFDCDA